MKYIGYDFDIQLKNENRHCLIIASVVIDVVYTGNGTPCKFEILMSNINKIFQEKMNGLDIKYEKNKSPKCCCDNISMLMLVIPKGNALIEKLDIKSNPKKNRI